MKSSKYNIFFDRNGKTYVFNTMTCALAEINKEINLELDKAVNLKFNTKEKFYMKNAGFIVDDDIDELILLRYRHYRSKDSNFFGVVIAPTMMCNFNCHYCYENSNNHFIKDEVKEAIYKKIDDILSRGKLLDVSWFGGEPLLAKDVIKEMSEKIRKKKKKHNIECMYNLVTNGYLLDASAISELLSLGINHAKITIDGPPEIHNKRRRLKGSSADTFSKIIENIKTAVRMGMKIRIRVNADKTNAPCLNELLQILAKEGLQDCFIDLARVRGYTKTETFNTLSAIEYGNLRIEFAKKLKGNGFKLYGDLCYPFRTFSMCGATVKNNLIIDPDGYLYRCTVEMGNIKNSYGNVLNFSEKDKESMNNLKYLTINPFEREECVNCKVLPLCMGGCAYYTLKNKNELDCSHWKYNLQDELSELFEIMQ